MQEVVRFGRFGEALEHYEDGLLPTLDDFRTLAA